MILKSASVLKMAFAAMAAFGQAPAKDGVFVPDKPIECPNCAAWNAPHTPFRIYGNSYYVGPAGLASVLIATKDGLVLIDGGLPQSALVILDNIRALGFQPADIKLILNSHIHYDHAGGIAALRMVSGARVAASAPSAKALALGHATADDPQYGFVSAATNYAPVDKVDLVEDGQVLTVGDVAFTAHLTPGHTPGGTSWTWQSCEAGRCLNMVYADSLTAVSDDSFHFTGDANHASRVEGFRASIAKIAALPCDVLMTPHPDFFQMEEKLAARKANPKTNPFIDPGACAAYAAGASAALDQRIADEKK